MTISEYRTKHALSLAGFAELIGEKYPQNVQRWENGEAIPRRATMDKIKSATKGEVTEADIYAASPKVQARA